jgi:manganese/zinc/iron transport system permease protein
MTGLSENQLAVLLIALLTAAACALPGALLVLRRMALVSDAISHTVVLGIVLAWFATHDLTSPLLFVGATASGVLTVWLIEVLIRSGRVREDAAIGLVFPALFAIAVILISRYASMVHIDTDAVLLGELAFAPFNRLILAGRDLGPFGLWQAAILFGLNLLFILLFYKELKLASFDSALAAAMGFAPLALHYALVTLTSLTAVGSFDAVGAILVVALMIAPPAAAWLLTERFGWTLSLSVLLGMLSAALGYALALRLDVSIAGCMALMAGAVFAAVLCLAPQRGLVAGQLRRKRQRLDFAEQMLLVHLLTHRGTASEQQESAQSSIASHLNWQPAFTRRVLALAQKRCNILPEAPGGLLELSEQGIAFASKCIGVQQPD